MQGSEKQRSNGHEFFRVSERERKGALDRCMAVKNRHPNHRIHAIVASHLPTPDSPRAGLPHSGYGLAGWRSYAAVAATGGIGMEPQAGVGGWPYLASIPPLKTCPSPLGQRRVICRPPGPLLNTAPHLDLRLLTSARPRRPATRV